QAPEVHHARRQPDVGAAPGHVGGNGDPSWLAGAGDDLRLVLVLTGVEHHVWQPGRAQQRAQVLGGGDRARADQDGTALAVPRLAPQPLAAAVAGPRPAERARELVAPPAAVRRQRAHALTALADPVATALELLRERQRRLVDVAFRRVSAGRAGNDERRARL